MEQYIVWLHGKKSCFSETLGMLPRIYSVSQIIQFQAIYKKRLPLPYGFTEGSEIFYLNL